MNKLIAFRGSEKAHKKVKVVAAQTGKSMGDIYEEAIEAWLKKNAKEPIKRADKD